MGDWSDGRREVAEDIEAPNFTINGKADYDYDLIRDILYVPNGIDNGYLEENYVLTGYINDINTKYTQVLMEYGSDGVYDSIYEYGLQRTSLYQNGQVYSYEYDGRGSVSELVNAIGATQVKYSYGAYGETISTVIGWNNPITNPYRYNAERIDDVAGVPAFQYLRARYMNPYTANFLTRDTYIGQLNVPLSQNRYTYAHNNPVMFIDPSGHSIKNAVLNYFDNKKYENIIEKIEEKNINIAFTKLEYDNLKNQETMQSEEMTALEEIIEDYKSLQKEKSKLCGEAIILRGNMASRGKTNYRDIPEQLFTLESTEIWTMARLIYQDTEFYCWVAASSMLMSAKDRRISNSDWRNDTNNYVTQKQIVEGVLWPNIDNQGYKLDADNKRIYTTDSNGNKVYENTTGSVNKELEALEYISEKTDMPYRFKQYTQELRNDGYTISEKKVQAYLLLNYPIVINYSRTAEINGKEIDIISHAEVIAGYDAVTGTYMVYNPWKSEEDPVERYTFEELLNHEIDKEGQVVKYSWATSVVFDVKGMEKYE